MAKNHLFDNISSAQTEEELKFAFAKFFNLPFNTKKRVDLYNEQIFFEFKLNSNLHNNKILAKTVAQALYYVRRLIFSDDDRSPSDNICVVTKNFAAFFPTETFSDFYNDKARFDWDLKPSLPCKKLVAALAAFEPVIHAHIYDFSNVQEDIAFATMIMQLRKRQNSIFSDKKPINQNNFYQIFQHWLKFFGQDVANGHKPSEYFLLNIEQGKSSLVDNNSVIFRMSGGDIKEKIINPDEYKYFWNHYAKITSANEIIAIRQKMDVMTEINLRRFTGEFYTPIDFAKKAFDYLTRTVGKWWNSDNFRLWDMAAGTGNLEFAIPPEALKFCYISTLINDESDYCMQIFPNETAFQFDFLNDFADKLPKNLKNDLNNPNLRWIIFINPPYATANDFQKKNFRGVISNTSIREQIIAENFRESTRELYVQFLYRISKDFANRMAYLGIFSTLRYIRTRHDKKFREKIFNYKFERGFIFNSKNFDGCNGQFPVGFIVWNLSEHISLEKTKKFPPMSSALKIGYENKARADKIAENFLAGFMCAADDFSHQNYTAFLSGPYVSGHGMSITPENFEQAMIVHMVRKLPKATWLNNKGQFLKPNKPLSREFIADAVIWSLFSASNQTASIKNVEYEGKIYQIRNNFYPFELSEIKSWECTSPAIRMRIATAFEDRFAALWIKNNRADLSNAAKAVLNAGREIYKRFYAELWRLDVRKWKITDLVAGWYQIRMSLDAKLSLEELSAKLEPQIYELGFLRDAVRYF